MINAFNAHLSQRIDNITISLQCATMGNTFKSVYELNAELYQWKKIFDHLQLTKQHIKILHKEFRFVDVEKLNVVYLKDLINWLEMEEKSYSHRVFGIFDLDDTSEIDFGEFVAALWNYCTLDKEDLGTLVCYLLCFI